MRAFKALVLAGALVGIPGLALAADVPQSEPVPEAYGTSSGWYLRGDVGWSFLDWSGNDDAITGGGGVGYRWNQWLRTDVRGDFSGEYDTGEDFNTVTVLGNAYVDFPVSQVVKPYIGAGAGWGWVTGDGDGDDNGVAFALMGGLSFDVAPHWTIDVGYRFRDVLLDGPDVTDHSALAGVRFQF